MIRNRNRLYLLLLAGCIAAFAWLFINRQGAVIGLCPIKHATGLPCPSCGTTRAVTALFSGDFSTAFLLNPFGYLVACIMLVAPLWIATDMLLKKDSLFACYKQTVKALRFSPLSVLLVLLVVINWAWNIVKGI